MLTGSRKLGSFDRCSLKREARRFLEKIRSSPLLWENFKVLQHHLVQFLAIRHLTANCPVRHTSLRLRLWFYIIQGLENAQWKNSASTSINCQLRNKLFFVICRFSLVKVAMNAPHLCKSHNGVNKRLHFFIFLLPKVEQRRSRTRQLRRGWVSEVNFGMKKKTNPSAQCIFTTDILIGYLIGKAL
jgi:hypothetical protein